MPAQHRDLLSQHQDFGVLGRLAAGEQSEPAEELMLTHLNGDTTATESLFATAERAAVLLTTLQP